MGYPSCTLEVLTGPFLLHLLDNEYCRARSSRSQHMPGASTAYFLVPVWFLLTFIESFYSVFKTFLQFGMNTEVRNTNGSWSWELLGCQNPMLPSSALARSCCTCARACSLFTGCAGQCCGDCRVKEASKATVVSKVPFEKFVSGSLLGALEAALAIEVRNRSGQNLLPDFVF